jgi:hypothetical protein
MRAVPDPDRRVVEVADQELFHDPWCRHAARDGTARAGSDVDDRRRPVPPGDGDSRLDRECGEPGHGQRVAQHDAFVRPVTDWTVSQEMRLLSPTPAPWARIPQHARDGLRTRSPLPRGRSSPGALGRRLHVGAEWPSVTGFALTVLPPTPR